MSRELRMLSIVKNKQIWKFGNVVTKQFFNFEKWQGEVDIYKHYQSLYSLKQKNKNNGKKQNQNKFMPKFIGCNEDFLTLSVSYEGESLNEKYGLEEREKLIPDIRKLVNNFELGGYYHNDVSWKNITENSNGELCLIDFDRASKENTDRNDDGIL